MLTSDLSEFCDNLIALLRIFRIPEYTVAADSLEKLGDVRLVKLSSVISCPSKLATATVSNRKQTYQL